MKHTLAVRPEDDDTGFTAVAVCTCGRSWIGAGQHRRRDAFAQYKTHAADAPASTTGRKTPKPRNRQKVDDSEIRRMLLEGKTSVQIRTALGVGGERIGAMRGALGLPRRIRRPKNPAAAAATATERDERREQRKAREALVAQMWADPANSIKAIAEATGLKYRGVREVRKRLDLPPRNVSAVTDAEILEAFRGGMKPGRIAGQLRVGLGRVYRLCREQGDQ